MTRAPGCSRSWQAEAAEDRRLSDADRASFERHVPTCAVCERAVRELLELRKLAARTETAPSAPLEHRRARNELLRRANELTLRAPRSTPWRSLAVAATLAVLCAAVLVGLRLRRSTPERALATGEPSYELVASADAEWSSLERGPTLKLSTRRGRFELSVRHLSQGQRFVLVLPDGELEVQGTRFVVEVDGARTLSVSVTEGRVALRVRERAGSLLVLGAGERFSSEALAAPPAGSAPPPPADTGSPLAAPAPSPNDAAPTASSDPSMAPASSAARSDSESSGGAEFKRAMSAFSSGNYGEAEKLFQAFAARHPADPRAEDATFLSAVATARRGDPEGARALAKRYLARYPRGLRRREAERLAK
jgi:ferric-dicitrate binding protein FerR (iron transport regulator)